MNQNEDDLATSAHSHVSTCVDGGVHIVSKIRTTQILGILNSVADILGKFRGCGGHSKYFECKQIHVLAIHS